MGSLTPAALRERLGLSVAAMAQLVGVTRQGWYKIERTGQPSPPVARLLAYIERYGPELAKEMMTTISERLRRGPLSYRTGSGPVYVGPTLQDTEAADTIDSLVAALRDAREAIPTDDYFKVRPKIDAALALARGGK